MTEVVPIGDGSLELLSTLEQLGAAASLTSLTLPDGLSYDRYSALGVALGRAQQTVTWMLADWINYGERAYGEKYAQAVHETGLNEETLMKYAYVARRIPKERRRPELRFTVHAEVASLEPKEQVEWLEKAVVNDWKRADLRSQLRPEKSQWKQSELDLATKKRVHGIVNRAIQAGKLMREPCEICGKEQVEAHHEDYDKPLEVRWLCVKHHREQHREPAPMGLEEAARDLVRSAKKYGNDFLVQRPSFVQLCAALGEEL